MSWRVGIVGVGRFAEQAYLPALRELPNVTVALLCGRSRERTEATKRAWSLEAIVVEGSRGLAKALEDDLVDAAIVAVPDALHAEMVRLLLEAKRHVLCEKPFTVDQASAQELRDLAASAGVANMVAFTYRYTLAVQRARQMIEEGALGEVAMVHLELHYGWEGQDELAWREDVRASAGGIWFDGGSHFVDTVGVLVGPLAGMQIVTTTIDRSNGSRATNADVVAASGYVKPGMPWGRLAHRGASNGQADRIAVAGALSRVDAMSADKIQVTGSDASLRLSLGRGDIEWVDLCSKAGSRSRVLAVEAGPTGRTGPPMAIARMVRAWVDSLERGHLSDQDAGFDIGFSVQEILMKAMRGDSGQCDRDAVRSRE